MRLVQTSRYGCEPSCVAIGVAATLLVALDGSAAQAQRQERGASQLIRIAAHVKAFCWMGIAHHGSQRGVRIDDRMEEGHIDRRLGGVGHFNVICNSPYSVHFHRRHHNTTGLHGEEGARASRP